MSLCVNPAGSGKLPNPFLSLFENIRWLEGIRNILQVCLVVHGFLHQGCGTLGEYWNASENRFLPSLLRKASELGENGSPLCTSKFKYASTLMQTATT